MAILDHFRPPLSDQRRWESFHSAWASELMAMLNQELLPAGYFAETQVHLGPHMEIDVATLEGDAPGEGRGGVALDTAAATAVLVLPFTFPEVLEVRILRTEGGPTLVAAIELVSPGNKDRRENRRAFAAKCATLLHQGVGLMVVDLVTSRQSNLHDEMIDLCGMSEDFRFPEGPSIYAAAYRPFRSETPPESHLEVRLQRLAVGEDLPTLPLALRGGPRVAIDLEEAYMRTRHRCLL